MELRGLVQNQEKQTLEGPHTFGHIVLIIVLGLPSAGEIIALQRSRTDQTTNQDLCVFLNLPFTLKPSTCKLIYLGRANIQLLLDLISLLQGSNL